MSELLLLKRLLKPELLRLASQMATEGLTEGLTSQMATSGLLESTKDWVESTKDCVVSTKARGSGPVPVDIGSRGRRTPLPGPFWSPNGTLRHQMEL